ncbi:DUF4314 domain-containing protein [Actinotignum urinale]|uniref:DUF4314 domain-containing protein n=1 Tax=Actinotignum urinale TaxID=190146 RepID=UPI0003B43A76|nr:DUF4314 domain-containing protein [Actinotignum urinale]MDY5159654.1 DUF4314 domain-containing protein [Actinotignum urinale]
MRTPTRKERERIEQAYPIGSVVELVEMNDPHAPRVGTKGRVLGIDDIGSLLVAWENGSHLHVLWNIDRVKIVEK